TNKTEHARHTLDQMPSVVIHFHVHEHVAGEELALGGATLAVLDLHHFLGRHQNIAKILFHALARDMLFQRITHFFLILGKSLYDIPMPGHNFLFLSVRPNQLATSDHLYTPTEHDIHRPDENRQNQHHDEHHERGLDGFAP